MKVQLYYYIWVCLVLGCTSCFNNNEVLPDEEEWISFYNYEEGSIYQISKRPQKDGYYIFSSAKTFSPINGGQLYDVPFIIQIDFKGEVRDTIIGSDAYADLESQRHWVAANGYYYAISGAPTAQKFIRFDPNTNELFLEEEEYFPDAYIVNIGPGPNNTLLVGAYRGSVPVIEFPTTQNYPDFRGFIQGATYEIFTVNNQYTLPLWEVSMVNGFDFYAILVTLWPFPTNTYAPKLGYFESQGIIFIYTVQGHLKQEGSEGFKGASGYSIYMMPLDGGDNYSRSFFLEERERRYFDFDALVLNTKEDSLVIASRSWELYPYQKVAKHDTLPLATPFSVNGFPINQYDEEVGLVMITMTIGNRDALAYIGATQSGEVLLSAFDRASGDIIGKKELTDANQNYQVVDAITTADGGLLLCGHTVFAGRQKKIFVMKFSKASLDGLFN